MKQNGSIISKTAIGVGISSLVTVLLSAILAWLIGKGSVEITAMDLGSSAIHFLASLAGCLVAARGEKGMVKGLITAAAYILLLLCVNALFLDGRYIELPMGLLAVLLGSIVAIIVNNLPKKRSTIRRRKR